MFGRTTDIIEKKDIQRITDIERDKSAGSQFFLWFASNLTIGDLALGSLIYAITGLSFTWMFVSILIGNVLGGTLLALMSVTGPRTGLPQMMIGRISFGELGGRVMAFLQWLNSVGWFIFNSVIAASALLIIFEGERAFAPQSPFSGMHQYLVPIIVAVVVVAFLAFVGQRIIHMFEKLMSAVLGILFVVILIYIVGNYGFPSLTTGGFSAVGFGLSVALTFSYIMSWGPYAADYSRYVKEDAPPSSVFLATLGGGIIASVFVEIIGYTIATNISSSSEISAQIFSILAPLHASIIGLFAIFLGGMSANALNLYSNSLSMKSMGIKARRTTIVLYVVLVSIVVSYFLYQNYYSYFEDFLLLLDYWITPWLGIMIADFFIVRRMRVDLADSKGSAVPALLVYVSSILVSIPFMNPGYLIVGPLSNYFGGVDISYFVSFIVAVVLYSTYTLRKRTVRTSNVV